MGLIDKLFSVKKIEDYNDTELTISGDISDATVKDPLLKFNRPRYVKQVQYRANDVTFKDSEYDLSTIASAVQLDGILNRSVNIFTEQINKNGYEISIPNDKVYEHVTGRLREIELFTNIKNTEIVNTLSRQLVTYGNAYLIKSRKSGLSKTGKPYKMYNKTFRPIVGLFVADASTMKIGLDRNNQIKYYKQVINGQERTYQADDVIHLYYNKVPGLLTGRSAILPVLDDVRALRKLEEEAEILGFQYAVPLYLYKVGTDNHPAAPGEVDSVAMEINHMNTYGIMCVPHTHNVETVTSDNDPIDIIKYIEHFKKRVYSGLGVSPVAMGESDTSNRNTAEAAYISMQSVTKSYQQILKEKLEIELLKELILDGGFAPQRFEYELRFNEIDLEATIKKETHALQKYQGNLITRDEARIEMDLEPKLDEKGLYLNQVQIPLLQAESIESMKQIDKQAEASIKVAKNTPQQNTSGGSSASASKGTSNKAKNASKSSEKSTTSKSQPSNQHGKQLSRPTFKKDMLDENVDYVSYISRTLLSNNNCKSNLNRSTFINKSLDNVKSTILKIVESNDTLNYNDVYTKFELRLKDRVNRLATVDSIEKYDYIIKSILDEIKSLDVYLELNDGEEEK